MHNMGLSQTSNSYQSSEDEMGSHIEREINVLPGSQSGLPLQMKVGKAARLIPMELK